MRPAKGVWQIVLVQARTRFHIVFNRAPSTFIPFFIVRLFPIYFLQYEVNTNPFLFVITLVVCMKCDLNLFFWTLTFSPVSR